MWSNFSTPNGLILTRPLNTIRLYALEDDEFIEGFAAKGFDQLSPNGDQ